MAASKKDPVVIDFAGPLNAPLSGLLTWVDQRFPMMSMYKDHLSEYYAPKNFNFWYYFGSLALMVLVLQIVTGIFLVMHYKPSAAEAFASVEYIMRDVPAGWLIRYLHSTGASAFFVVIYLHMYRGLMYGSYRAPRELIWIFGMVIYLSLMAEAFFGYLLPWGQMSFWGAQVIVNLFDALPIIGPDLSTWVRGDFVVSDATLNRFFAFHVIAIPLAILGLVAAHILALHEVGSNNPDGIEIKEHKGADGHPLDGIPFHPYYTVKDALGVTVFLAVFSLILFFAPEMGGYFLEYNNFVPADPLKTPPHIAPVWYFTPFYSILRAITEDFMWALRIGVVLYTGLILFTARGCLPKLLALLVAPVVLIAMGVIEPKVWGVVFMGVSTLIFFLLPWLDKSPVKSIRYKGKLSRWALTIFTVVFLVLGYYGTQSVTPIGTLISQIGTLIYFAYFMLMPWYTQMEQTLPVPDRVTM